MMKKQITTLFLAVVLTFSLAAVGFAEEKQAETPVDPNATNLTAIIPAQLVNRPFISMQTFITKKFLTAAGTIHCSAV